MRRWLTILLLAASLAVLTARFILNRPIVRGPGVVAPAAPLQQLLEAQARPSFQKDGYRIRALASFTLEARALRTESYCCWGADSLAPLDVAFGWGRMSDEAVLAQLDIDQSRRFYSWRYADTPPIPRREIETSSANMHLIPASRLIEKRLKQLRPGHLVTLRGYLVEVRGENGFVWRSSLTRGDTGNHACELIWVEELEAS